MITVDVDLAVKEQRNHRIVRMPVKRDTLRGVLPSRPETHFMVIADDSKVVASGHVPAKTDGRFAATLPALKVGIQVFGEVLADGNAVGIRQLGGSILDLLMVLLRRRGATDGEVAE